MSEGPQGLGSPPIELWMKEDGLLLGTLVPGVRSEDVDVSLEGDTLTLKIARRVEAETTDVRWHRRERSFVDVERRLRLPFTVDAAGVRATLVNGRLQIELPRAESDKPRRVPIQVN
jgi:HSP20 family protein